jgi:flagellar basal body-associated protein FliL
MFFLKHPVLLVFAGACLTTFLGYLINQMPEIPHKAENYRLIILAVVIVTMIIGIVGVKINSTTSQLNPTIGKDEIPTEKEQGRATFDIDAQDNAQVNAVNEINATTVNFGDRHP